MKNNTKTYLLLVAVLSIWGTVAYKIINRINPGQPEVLQQNFDIAFNPKQLKPIDTFSIQPVDRDPFLGTLTTKRQPTTTKRRTKPIEPEVPMPNISYGGLIQKQGDKTKVYVVNINNQQYLLKQGQTVADVTLVNGTKNSITIRFNGKNKTIKL